MDQIERTLISTQNLLCAIEQDSSLLNDEQFMQKLKYLRAKHKETTNYLATAQNRATFQRKLDNATYHSTPGCNHFWSDLPAQDDPPINSHQIHGGCHLVERKVPQPIDSHQIHGRRENMERAQTGVYSYQDQHNIHTNFMQTRQPNANFDTRPKISDSFEQSRRSTFHDRRKDDEKINTYEMHVASTSAPIVRDAAEVLRNMESYRKGSAGRQNMDSTRRELQPDSPIVLEENDIEKEGVHESERRRHEDNRRGKNEGRTSLVRVHSKSEHDLSRRNDQEQKRTVVHKKRTTVPKPFKMTERASSGNTYSQRFLNELIEQKKREEKEEEERRRNIEPFKAHPVPSTTYESTNPLDKDQSYIDALQKRVQRNMQRSFLNSRSKSMTDVVIARPVPVTTYVPDLIPNYNKDQKLSERSIRLLTQAHTPPGLKEHAVRTTVASRLRHSQCRTDPNENRQRRISVPDFKRLHKELNDQLNRPHSKQVTIPVPFHLSENRNSRHRECQSSSPVRKFSPNRRISTEYAAEFPVHTTHSVELRAEAVRKQLERIHEKDYGSQRHREQREEEKRRNRERLRTVMKRSQSVPSITVEERRQNLRETTREYERQLAEMRRRVMARPLVMERQIILAHQQKLEKKYKETMSTVGKVKPPRRREVEQRRDSQISGGTFSVKSNGKQEDETEMYRSDSFESEASSKSSAKSSNSNSKSSTSSTSSTSSSSSKSSKSSKLSKISEKSSSSHS